MITFGSKKKSLLGVDLGHKMTKVVQLDTRSRDSIQVVRADVLEIGLEDEGTLVEAVRAHLAEAGLKHSQAAMSFDDNTMKIRRVELPEMPPQELIEAVRWNLRDIVEEEIDKYTVTHSEISKRIEEGSEPRLELLAFAVKREAVATFKRLAERMTLNPVMIEPKTVGLAASLDRFHPEPDSYRAGLDIGASQSLFYVIGKRRLVFSRPLVGISLALAEQSPEEFPKALAIEVQRSIDTFQVTFGMEALLGLSLSGGGALRNDLTDYFQVNLGIETDIIDPFAAFEGGNLNDVKTPLFAQAASLAIAQS